MMTLRDIKCSATALVIWVGVLAFAASACVGFFAGIPEPRVHDEFSYLLAADTFAHGRLTNPIHPMWRHFETFHVIQQPSYMSKYPPAQGAVLALGQVLGGQPIFGVWLSFGLMCAATTWMLTAWTSRRWALLGALLAMAHPVTGIAGYWAQSYWGGAAAATGGALLLGGFRRVMRRPCAFHAFLIGVGLAILANSRPYEGLVLSLPAGVFLLAWMWSDRGPSLRVSLARIVAPIVVVLALTATWMCIYNLRVTGASLRLPYQVHEATYAITPNFLWEQPLPEPEYRHPILREFQRSYALPLYQGQLSITGFARQKLLFLCLLALAALNVFIIPLIGCLPTMIAWIRRNMWARRAAVIYVVFVAGLLGETLTFLHYTAPVMSLSYFFSLNTLRFWQRRKRPAGRFMLPLASCVTVLLLTSSLYGRIALEATAWQAQRAGFLRQMKEKEGKHLIVVAYGPHHLFHREWVYNEADIDNTKVIFARQMDRVQDCELAGYFRLRQIWLLEVDDDRVPPELKPYPISRCS